MNKVKTGYIKRIWLTRGFGFISGVGIDKEVFFHISDLVEKELWEKLHEGTHVSFIVTEGAKGPRAEAIQVETAC